MKSVLIAHQSTVPHYRVPFYNTLQRLKPDRWRFQVAFDSSEIEKKRFFQEPLNINTFEFPTLEAKSAVVKLANKRVSYQAFFSKVTHYDLVIVEHAVNNLAYPLSQLYQTVGLTKFAYWGLGKDKKAEKPSIQKILVERLKSFLARKADGYFAYTEGVKNYLENQGLSSHKIFVLNNTIDIEAQRRLFHQVYPEREATRRDLGLAGKKVLLFVGRFIKNKRIDFLLDAFSVLQERDPDFHLLLVGAGSETYLKSRPKNVSVLGAIADLEELGRIYTVSDVLAFPGAVGLGPLQAFCYDLPAIIINSSTHGPEVEYLSPANSITLPASTSPAEYAQEVSGFFDHPDRLRHLRAGTWPSIRHLTIEAMAHNFINGVDSILLT